MWEPSTKSMVGAVFSLKSLKFTLEFEPSASRAFFFDFCLCHLSFEIDLQHYTNALFQNYLLHLQISRFLRISEISFRNQFSFQILAIMACVAKNDLLVAPDQVGN